MRALILSDFNGADGVAMGELPAPTVGGDDGRTALIEVHAAGVSFADMLITRGLYQLKPSLPFVPGLEVAGVVREAPTGCGFDAGDRVAAFMFGGAFAEEAVVAAESVTPTPPGVEDRLAAAFGLLTWNAIWVSLEATVKVAGMVFFIIISSSVFSQLVAYSGASAGLLNWVTSFHLSVAVMIVSMFAVLLLLGMFMDPVSMILISVPIFMPLVGVMKIDPIWFGLFVLLVLEMSQTTPPFGLLLYIMLGVAPKGTTLFQVSAAAFPFLVCDAILLALLLLFPALALYLPSLMR